MKITNFKIPVVKSLFIVAVFVMATILSCKKEDSEEPVADEEIAEISTQAVSSSTGGLSLQAENTIQLAIKNNLTCGMSKDTTIVKSNTVGLHSYNFTFNATKSMVCTNNVPSTLNYTFKGVSSYSAPKMSSNDNSEGQFAITGLPVSSANYIVNGNYVRNGTQQSKVKLKRNLTSTVTIVASNINISKTTMKIVSGTATVQIDVTTSGGKNISTSATLNFLGDNSAKLIFKSGAGFNIQW